MSKCEVLESPCETMTKHEQNWGNMAKMRALNVSIDYAIAIFQSKTKDGSRLCLHCMSSHDV